MNIKNAIAGLILALIVSNVSTYNAHACWQVKRSQGGADLWQLGATTVRRERLSNGGYKLGIKVSLADSDFINLDASPGQVAHVEGKVLEARFGGVSEQTAAEAFVSGTNGMLVIIDHETNRFMVLGARGGAECGTATGDELSALTEYFRNQGQTLVKAKATAQSEDAFAKRVFGL